MFLRRSLFVASLALACQLPHLAWGQSSGSRGGLHPPASPAASSLPLLNREVAESFITVEGSAEVRVAPSEVRVVLAVVDEAETAVASRERIGRRIDELRRAWAGLEIANEQVVVDFIAVLPQYEWIVEQRGEREVGVERKSGYRTQFNVHLAVKSEQAAQEAIGKAMELGVTDIIAVDHGSDSLSEARSAARRQALEAAREKARFLLEAMFEQAPPAINVQEQTSVQYPASQYESFTAADSEGISLARRDLPLVRAPRPRNTYYRGSLVDVDRPAAGLPLRPEISVTSVVRLYYASPARATAGPQ